MRLYLGHARSFGVPKLRALALAGWIAASSLPAAAAELARPNGIEEGFTLWSSSAEYRAFWKAYPPRNPRLMADMILGKAAPIPAFDPRRFSPRCFSKDKTP